MSRLALLLFVVGSVVLLTALAEPRGGRGHYGGGKRPGGLKRPGGGNHHYGPRPGGGHHYGPRPGGVKPPFGPRPGGGHHYGPGGGKHPFGPRPGGGHPFGPRPGGGHPFGPRPGGGHHYGPRPGGGKHPFGPRPGGGKHPFGPRPGGGNHHYGPHRPPGLCGLGCLNGGICTLNLIIGKFQCKCPSGFTGSRCQQPVGRCGLTCLNGGICIKLPKRGKLQCKCPSGFTGSRCQQRLCGSGCLNGGICISNPRSRKFHCKCPSGFTGRTCQQPEHRPKPCDPNPCKNGGHCKQKGVSFHCICPEGFQGITCKGIKIGVCTATGDPHYTSFDGRRYNFMGICRYVLARHDDTFEVLQKNEPCGNGKVACTKAITVNVKGLKIHIVRGGRVTVDGTVVRTPYDKNGVCIVRKGRVVTVTSDVGLTVVYNGVYNVFVKVSAQYSGKLSGLCGNFNGDKTDDLKGKDPTTFGNSWNVDPNCGGAPGPPVHPCKSNANFAKLAKEKCSLLCKAPFDRCNGVLDPRIAHIPDCEYDVCSTDGATASVCEAYADYSEACAIYGINIKWRNDVKFKRCLTPCSSAPCLNGGKCEDKAGGKFQCKCPPGYQGERCEKGPCHSSPCKNGGTCIEDNGSFTCKCPPNFKGPTCAEPILKPCDPNPCKNGGKCKEEGVEFYCICPDGFQGITCEVTPCSSAPCLNGGTCVDKAGGKFQCKCPPGYQGKRCEKGPCDSSPCKNGGTCIEDNGSFTCKCPPNFKGPKCAEPILKPCDPNPCKNGGKCKEEGVEFYCICPEGFEGITCEVTPCSSAPCLNGGTCVDKAGGKFQCKCPPGYQGERCEKGPCDSSPCKNGGTCIEDNGSFTCKCPPNFKGPTCEVTPCSSAPCLNGGKCEDKAGGKFQCKCPPGYQGERCEKGPCYNSPCKNGGTCIEDKASFTCKCPPNYKGPTCEVTPCSSAPCLNGGKCEDKAGGTFQCKCPPGYQGERCEKGPCYNSPCKNGGTCIEDKASFTCKCPPNYKGPTCEVTPCSSAPCLNGGKCEDKAGGTFQCKCPPGYQGERCEKGPCYNSPCKNGGTCIEDKASFTCKCPPNYKGPTCEVTPCSSAPCLNGGKCEDKAGGTFQCKCPPGYQGERCEKGPCYNSPCKNGGTCIEDKASFTCKCPPNYKGPTCEVTPCSSAPCLNGGTCVDKAGGTFQCKCPPGYQGKRCENGPCDSSPCKNGGTCTEDKGSFTCKCPPNFKGPTCEGIKTGVCIATGDPHYTTFDGKRYNFMGKCLYVLARHDDTFEVLQKNEPCGNGKVTCTKEITVNVKGLKIHIVRGGRVTVDGTVLTTPYDKNGVSIVRKGRAVTVTSDVGLTVVYNGVYNVFVKVSAQYSGKLSGLCGNFNGDKTDDLKGKDPTTFGNFWNVDPNCGGAPKPPVGPCKSNANLAKLAKEKCCLLSQAPFDRCNGVLDPRIAHIPDCEYDVCSTDGATASVCEAYADYSEACAIYGINIKWRNDVKFKDCLTPCSSAPCLNGGKCEDKAGGTFQCKCPPEYQGERCEKEVTKPCDPNPCKNGGKCKEEGDSFYCKCPEGFKGTTCEEVKCTTANLDLLYVVDGSGSVKKKNFDKIKEFIKQLTARFEISAGQTHVGFIQFARFARIEFRLGEFNSIAEVDKAIDGITYFNSLTFTGKALQLARTKVFTKIGGRRSGIPNVLVLLTDGESLGGSLQFTEAEKLKKIGVKIITVGMGKKATIDIFKNDLKKIASVASDGESKLVYEANFNDLETIANELVKESCSTNASN